MATMEAALARSTASIEERPDGTSALSVVGLFAGIGGIELGFNRAGHQSVLLCEIEPNAKAVLESRFSDVPVVSDVRELPALPPADVVTAGFPCQDLSQAGRTAGISGAQSSLVAHVFRLIEDPARSPKWLVLENVPFMLQLDKGEAMRFLTSTLVEHGFTWAYRVVDTRAFGLPQRRRRVILVASRDEDPRTVLFSDDAGEHEQDPESASAFGFYWTEGVRGLGWAVEAVPTLKGGSTIGIPSPPAVWLNGQGFVGTPDIRDAERLQGFDAEWTVAAGAGQPRSAGARWKLVGNAVSVPVAEWLGRRLAAPGEYQGGHELLAAGQSWPIAAWGDAEGTRRVEISSWPIRRDSKRLSTFLEHPLAPLSVRATRGFLRRAAQGRLRFQDGFLDDVERHLDHVGGVDREWNLEKASRG